MTPPFYQANSSSDSLRCRPSRLFVRGIISISIWSRLKPNSMSHTMRNRSGRIFSLRDVASQLKYAKPALIHARFLDALQGPGSKMSASVESSSILVRDNPKQILTKINKYAFSGGQEIIEEHRTKGGNPNVDISYQYLRFFLSVSQRGACPNWPY